MMVVSCLLNSDLFELVACFLSLYPATLRSCALTCSWMRDGAQRHLFEECVVEDSAACETLVWRILANPRLGNYVRRLCVTYVGSDHYERLGDNDVEDILRDRSVERRARSHSRAYRFLRLLFSRLPAMQTLVLCGVQLHLVEQMGLCFLRVEVLELSHCGSLDCSLFLELVQHLPFLKTLRASGTRIFEQLRTSESMALEGLWDPSGAVFNTRVSVSQDGVQVPLPHLEELFYGGITRSTSLSALAGLVKRGVTKQIGLNRIRDDEVDILPLLEEAAPFLRHIYLGNMFQQVAATEFSRTCTSQR
jgi:hypothetical protein